MKKIKLFINEYKFYIINLFLIFYFTVNFFDGNRGYFSLQKKKVEFKELTQVEEDLRKKNIILKNQNEALTKKIDLNFLDEIYRKNFVVGKKNEKLIIIK
jgi:cell division protein FtsB